MYDRIAAVATFVGGVVQVAAAVVAVAVAMAVAVATADSPYLYW